MFPTLYQISEGFGIHTYGLMIMMGLLGAFVYSSNRARKIGVDSDELPLMYLLVAIAGVLGARLFYFLFSIPEVFFRNPFTFFDGSQGGLVFYGGAIGGVVVGVLFCLWKGISAIKMADIGAPAIMLGLAFGRVGCFLGGCCHGRPTESFIASLRPSIDEKMIRSLLRSGQTADDVFLSLAQNPDSAIAVMESIKANPSQLAVLEKMAKVNDVEVSIAPESFFRMLSEKMPSTYSQTPYPSAEASQLSEAVFGALKEDGWITLLSQSDLLSRIPASLQQVAADSVQAQSLTGDLLPGGEVVLLETPPTLALIFKDDVGVGSIFNIPLYPTQVWECFGAFFLFLSLAWMWKKIRVFDGQIMVTMMVFYAGLRSSIETFRGDKIRGEDWFDLLTTSQLISVVIVLLAALLALLLYPRGLAPEKNLDLEDENKRLNDNLDDLL